MCLFCSTPLAKTLAVPFSKVQFSSDCSGVINRKMEEAFQYAVTTVPVQEQNYDATRALLVHAYVCQPTQQQRGDGVPAEESNHDHTNDQLVIGK